MVAEVDQVRKLARREFARSFDPREWYTWDDDIEDTGGVREPSGPDVRGVTEARVMWVYLIIAGMFVVGFFTPSKEWVEDTVHGSQDEAAARVHYLNGGR